MLSHFSRVRLFVTLWTVARQAPPSRGFSRQEYWSGLPCLLPGIFLTQGSNPGLLHCRQILYQLSHQGSPGILVWVAYPFSRGSSRPRDLTHVSTCPALASGFFTTSAIWEATYISPINCGSLENLTNIGRAQKIMKGIVYPVLSPELNPSIRQIT